MKDILKLKVPKSVLIGTGAALWAFAAYRILSIGFVSIENNALHKWVDYLIGIAGAVPFFMFVFLNVSRKYFSRIIELEGHRFHIFRFMSLKGYLMMTFMISLGIASAHFKVIPAEYKGIFYVSLGLSLLLSALYYLFFGVKFILSGRKSNN